MSKNGWIVLIILVVISIADVLLRKKFILSRKIPQDVIDFPVYESAEGDYISVREKVKQFIDNTLEGKCGQLSLTANDLNCLSTRGVTPRKGEPLFPDSLFLLRTISHPVPL
jgi:hypothetical protein